MDPSTRPAHTFVPYVQPEVHGPVSDFIVGGLTAVWDGVTEPFKMLYDVEQVAVGTIGSLYTGNDPLEIDYASGFGKYIADQNPGTIGALASLPKGIITTPWRLGVAISDTISGENRLFDVGYETVNLFGAIELSKGAVRGFAPEPGAQLGIVRLGAKSASDLVDFNGVSGGLLPPLPGENLSSFYGRPIPKEYGPNELARVYEFGNPEAPFNGRWWMEGVPDSQAGWRGPYAVPEHGWSNAGTDLSTLQRPSTWAWSGETAAQAIPGYSWQFFSKSWSVGWYQPGGAIQAMIPNSYALIHHTDVTYTPTPWSH
jgi:hypothetical protein